MKVTLNRKVKVACRDKFQNVVCLFFDLEICVAVERKILGLISENKETCKRLCYVGCYLHAIWNALSYTGHIMEAQVVCAICRFASLAHQHFNGEKEFVREMKNFLIIVKNQAGQCIL